MLSTYSAFDDNLRARIEVFDKNALDEEPLYGSLISMGQSLIDGSFAIRELDGQNFIVLLGQTGSGMSCVVNALIQGSSCFNCCAKNKISSSFFDHIPYAHLGESVIYLVPIAERL